MLHIERIEDWLAGDPLAGDIQQAKKMLTELKVMCHYRLSNEELKQAKKDGRRLKKMLPGHSKEKAKQYTLVYMVSGKVMEEIITGTYGLCQLEKKRCEQSGRYRIGKLIIQ